MMNSTGLTNAEISQRILALLEEFGEENIFSTVNSIIDPKGSTEEVEMFTRALWDLVGNGHVTIAYATFAPRVVTDLEKSDAIDLLSGLPRWFRFDAIDRHWTLAKGDLRRERIPEICLTDAGRAKAVEILNERGVEWWRAKRR